MLECWPFLALPLLLTSRAALARCATSQILRSLYSTRVENSLLWLVSAVERCPLLALDETEVALSSAQG